MKTIFHILLLIGLVFGNQVWGQHVHLSGKVSVWGNYNQAGELDLWSGGRYLPQLNYILYISSSHQIDFEASANLNGAIGTLPFDSIYSDGNIKAYRAWARYSTNQFELRAGLQKINFGSSTMIRPLMWFDQVDPRDPLQFTDGVWGLLGRYYFLNNANLWLWVLYGNEEPKTWEVGITSQDRPEFGSRFQYPTTRGELALSFHHRFADTRQMDTLFMNHEPVPENRLGLDGKWDLGVGLWVEGVWFHRRKNIGMLTNQIVLSAGTDYTFGIGNGLHVLFEQLLLTYGEKSLQADDHFSFSILSVNYPFGILDNLGLMLYYDWNHHDVYNMLTWQRQFNNFSVYCIGFHNPIKYQIPNTSGRENLFGGTGFQIMFVYNH